MLKKILLILTFSTFIFETSFSQCIEREQTEIENAHIKLATKIYDLNHKKLSETEFENRVSAILDDMYKNYCSSAEITFQGKIGTISETKNGSDIFIRIDDVLIGGGYTILVNYQAKMPLSSVIGSKLKTLEIGDSVIFKFRTSNFYSPRNRSQAVEMIANSETGSFPMEIIRDDANDRVSDEIDYFYPITIALNKIAKINNTSRIGSKNKQIETLNDQFIYFVKKKKGKELANIVTERTLNLYGSYKSYALYYSEEKLKEYGLYDIMFTLILRNVFSAQELINANEKDIFAQQYFRMNIPLTSNNKIEIKNIEITSSSEATGRFYIENKDRGSIHYLKEENEWKIDFYPLFMQLKKKLNNVGQEALQKGYTIKEFSLYLLRTKFPYVKDNIWEPMNR